MMKRSLMVVLALAGAGSAAVAQSQWDTYDRVSTVTCGPRAVLLGGSHTDAKVLGDCRYVRVAGEHNDIQVEVAPGGTVEITGAHNDVWWRQSRPGPGPRLLNVGQSNTFHRWTD